MSSHSLLSPSLGSQVALGGQADGVMQPALAYSFWTAPTPFFLRALRIELASLCVFLPLVLNENHDAFGLQKAGD